eukprot:COSAG01_NODE_4984_length_4570_cov_2.557593_2_plen_53_part_00
MNECVTCPHAHACARRWGELAPERRARWTALEGKDQQRYEREKVRRVCVYIM